MESVWKSRCELIESSGTGGNEKSPRKLIQDCNRELNPVNPEEDRWCYHSAVSFGHTAMSSGLRRGFFTRV
jgi:hypothetical protein